MNINHVDSATPTTPVGLIGGASWNKGHLVTWGPGGSLSTSVVIGLNAGQNMNADQNATFVGAGAGQSNTTGTNNVCVGSSAGLANTIGANNTLLGTGAGASNTIGFSVTAVGYRAGIGNVSGDSNTFVGSQSGAANVSGTANAYFGSFAGWKDTGGANTYLGMEAAQVSTASNRNVFVGMTAGPHVTAANDNTLVGYQAGYNLQTGAQNVCVGDTTILASNVSRAIAIGYNTTVTANNAASYGSNVTNSQFNSVAIGDNTTRWARFGGSDGQLDLGSGNCILAVGQAGHPQGFGAASLDTANGSDTGYIDFGTLATAGGEKRAAALHAFLTADSSALITAKLNVYTTTAGVIAEAVHFDSSGITPAANRGLVCTALAGTPNDGNFTTPVNGLIVVDTSANKIWVRTGAATWKGVVVA